MKLLEEMYLQGEFDGKELFFIPHVKGSGPPIRSIYSKGLFYGFTDHTKRIDIIFALFLGLCLELKNLLTSLQQNAEISNFIMKVTGPASLNTFWSRLKADVLGCTVKTYNVDEAVSKGAALSIGLAQKWISAQELELNSKETFYPDTKRHLFYQSLFENKYRHFIQSKEKVEG